MLLQFGRMRAESHEGFLMALEKPELHVPLALQRRLVHRLQALSRQTFVSTHSLIVAALADLKRVVVLRNENGTLTSVPLLTSTLPAATPNSVRGPFLKGAKKEGAAEVASSILTVFSRRSNL